MRGRIVAGIGIAAAVAAGGVGGALIGVPGLSGAQPFPGNGTSSASAAAAVGRGARTAPLLDAAAKALNLTTQQLLDKLSDGKTTIADVAKQQNVDVNKVIDAMAGADHDRITKIVNEPWPVHGPGPGGFAPAFGPRMGREMQGLARAGLDTAAKALGISTDELRTDLRNGQSIADVAKAKHVDVNKVIDALVSAASGRLDQAVKDGRITQATADKIKGGLKSRITDMVNNALPSGWSGRHRGPAGFGMGGPGGPGGPDGFGGPGGPAGMPPTTVPPPAA